MNKLDKDYLALVQDILDNGVKKQDRTKTGTISVFGRQIRHKMSDGFPLLTTKKLHWKSIVSELLWFLQGRTDLRWLLEHDNTIWVGDCYANYDKLMKNSEWRYENRLNLNWFTRDHESETHMVSGPAYRPLTKEEFINKIKTDDVFAKKWGELGPIYGRQWRDWNDNGMEGDYLKGIDQIQNLINDLKTNPDSRRLMVSAWNVGELDQMVLPPCHYGFQVYTRELSLDERLDLMRKRTRDGTVDYDNRHHYFLDTHNVPKRAISLMWNQRSVDVGLGLPFNIASYGLLLEIIAKITNMVPDELIGNLGDTHLYLNHIEPIKEQLTREPFELPKLITHKTDEFWRGFDMGVIGHLDPRDFALENHQSHPLIKLPLSN